MKGTIKSIVPTDSTVTIDLLDDFATSTPFSLDSVAMSVVFDGGKHVVRTTGVNGVTVTTGNVTIKNVSFDEGYYKEPIETTYQSYLDTKCTLDPM